MNAIRVLPQAVPAAGDERLRRYLLSGALMGVAVLLLVLSGALLGRVPALRQLDYLGIFLINLLGSAWIAPAPGLLVLCLSAGTSGADPLLAGIAAGMGQTLGGVTGYIGGYGAAGFAVATPGYQRIRAWAQPRMTIALVLTSVIPNPIFSIVNVASGSVRYPLTRYFLVVGVSKTAKTVAAAYACLLAADALAWLF
jgi:membrane protein YqaA with SNARE-associated domain